MLDLKHLSLTTCTSLPEASSEKNSVDEDVQFFV